MTDDMVDVLSSRGIVAHSSLNEGFNIRCSFSMAAFFPVAVRSLLQLKMASSLIPMLDARRLANQICANSRNSPFSGLKACLKVRSAKAGPSTSTFNWILVGIIK